MSILAAEDVTKVFREGRETVTVVMELQVPEDAQGLRVDAEAVYPPD